MLDIGSDCNLDDEITHYLDNFMNPGQRDDQEPKKEHISKEECLRQVYNSRVGHIKGRTT